MMLQTALCNIKDEVDTLGYFTHFYEYAESIERGTEKFPQVYIGKGNYRPIYDLESGVGYVRKVTDVSVNLVGGENLRTTGCSDSNPLIDVAFPMRLVASVAKSKIADNAYSDDHLAFDLMAILGKKQPSVQNVSSVVGRVTSYSTDRDVVWSREIRGVDKQVRLDLVYMCMDFILTFRTNLDCININCNY